MAGYEARSFRGMGVFQSVPFEVSDDQDSVQMLQRSTQIGEFYRMSPPAVWKSTDFLPGAYMDVILYDEEKDQHVHIPFSEAFYAAGLGDISDPAAGATTPAYDLFGTLNTNILTDDVIAKFKSQPDFGGAGNPPNVAISLPAVAGDPVRPAFAGALTVNALKALAVAEVRVGLQYLLFYRLFDSADNLATARSIVECVNAGVWLPIEIVIARPFIEHMAMSAIMTVSGRDTGATLFGPADMQISANTSVKTIEGHYTCHTKSVITKPQNVMVLRDIMLSGYVAGNNTRWFGATSTYGVSGPLPAQDIQNDITERLSFANDSSGEYASMLAFAAHYGDGAKRDQVVSLSHRLLPWEVTRPTSEYKSYFPGGPTAFEVYSNRYQLGQIHFGEDIRAAENMEFISQGSVNNALCFVGPHRKYSAFTSNYYELQPGQGHFGPDAIPGDARWRRGESVSLAAARNSMVSLEVAAQSQLVMTRRDRGP